VDFGFHSAFSFGVDVLVSTSSVSNESRPARVVPPKAENGGNGRFLARERLDFKISAGWRL
jgi:hypothetical protein